MLTFEQYNLNQALLDDFIIPTISAHPECIKDYDNIKFDMEGTLVFEKRGYGGSITINILNINKLSDVQNCLKNGYKVEGAVKLQGVFDLKNEYMPKEITRYCIINTPHDFTITPDNLEGLNYNDIMFSEYNIFPKSLKGLPNVMKDLHVNIQELQDWDYLPDQLENLRLSKGKVCFNVVPSSINNATLANCYIDNFKMFKNVKRYIMFINCVFKDVNIIKEIPLHVRIDFVGQSTTKSGEIVNKEIVEKIRKIEADTSQETKDIFGGLL